MKHTENEMKRNTQTGEEGGGGQGGGGWGGGWGGGPQAYVNAAIKTDDPPERNNHKSGKCLQTPSTGGERGNHEKARAVMKEK